MELVLQADCDAHSLDTKYMLRVKVTLTVIQMTLLTKTSDTGLTINC